jgi:hypothetical protein
MWKYACNTISIKTCQMTLKIIRNKSISSLRKVALKVNQRERDLHTIIFVSVHHVFSKSVKYLKYTGSLNVSLWPEVKTPLKWTKLNHNQISSTKSSVYVVYDTENDRNRSGNLDAITRVQTWLNYSAFTDKVERNCHFSAPGWNCVTHRQALQGFPDTSQVSLHKNNENNLPFL